MTSSLLIDARYVPMLAPVKEASPSFDCGLVVTMLMTPPTARLPQAAEPPPRATSTRLTSLNGARNHWIVEQNGSMIGTPSTSANTLLLNPRKVMLFPVGSVV